MPAKPRTANGPRLVNCRVAPRGFIAAWLAFVVGALALSLGVGVESEAMATPFAIPHAYRLVAGAELFLLLIAYPLAATREGRPGRGDFWCLAVLLVFTAPAVVAAAWASGCGWRGVAASQGYLAAGAFFASGARGAFGSLYWALVMGAGAGAPLVAFVVEDSLRAGAGWLFALSPFWALDRLAAGAPRWWEWAFTCGVFIAAGIVFRSAPGPRRG